MALTFIDGSHVPPNGGWMWKHPQTGHELRGSTFAVLLDNIRVYCKANNLPVSANMENEVTEAICARTPGICREAYMPSIPQMWASFKGSMVQWVKQGAPVLIWDAMMERRDICTGSAEKGTNQCPEWHGDAGFHMGRCGKCGCLSLKLFLASEQCPLDKWPAVKDPAKLFNP